MAVGTEFYQRLTKVIKPEAVPGDIALLEDGAEALLEKLFFADAVIQRSRTGDSGFAYLRIITGQELGFAIGGSEGIRLLLNPNPSGGGTSFPISFRYEWEVLKYRDKFNFTNFGNTISGVFDVFKDVAQISDAEFLTGVISTFISGDNTIQQFSNRFNSYNSTGYQLNLTNGLSLNDSVLEILVKFEEQEIELYEVIFDVFLGGSISNNEFWENLKLLFKRWLNRIDEDRLLEIITPSFNVTLESLNAAIEFPEKILKPVDSMIPKSLLTFNIGSLEVDSKTGFHFNSIGNLSFTESEIANSGFTIGFTGAKLDLSKTTNIPEATADGRPNDFMGVYIQDGVIGFPAFWNQDDENSTGQITARNLLLGTGGISGKIGLEAKTAGNPVPLISAKFGSGFQVSLDAFSLEFQQNAIIGSEIKGTMKIPGFKDSIGNDAELGIDVHIGQDGEFSVTVSEADGIPLEIPNVLRFDLRSASLGRNEDQRFFLSISGKLSFTNAVMSNLLSDSIDFQEIIIWDDGQFEIKGGALELPKAIGLDRKPLKIAVTSIHLGSDEREYDNSGTPVMRKYKYFGFDGMVKVDPGGVEAKGKGIKLYISENDGYNLHMFIRIDSLKIDIIIPGDADPKDAAVLIAGFLSIKDAPAGLPGSEYAGGISIDLPQVGIGGSAAMRFNPKVPYFIIDVEVEISKAIPLGSTGMGLYGFRGLLGKHFVATKKAAQISESDPWWKYYKAKVENSYKEGVQIGKFEPVGGFALGFGVSLATSTDGGKVFSSKIFLLLSLRELIMLQGQAAILSERIKLNDPNDPPFFALIVITRQSIEAALGVNYKIPDDKETTGDIVTVQGVLELGFFFRDSSAWYLNIGRDLPESYRIGVRIFDLFDCYFYFMLSAKGIRTGAGAKFEVNKKWGPLEAYLYAYLDIAAKVAFKPKQFGGSIQLGGGIEISIFGLGFGITAAAGLAAEAPEPFNITGFVKACIKAVGKEWCAKFEFSWEFEDNVDVARIGVVNEGEEGIRSASQAVNIQTNETFPINYIANPSNGTIVPPPPTSGSWKGSFDNFVIPLDCFIDIDFKNGLNPIGNASTSKFGMMGGGANHILKVAPQKGKAPQVYHNFKVEDVVIYAWNPTANQWEEYDIYEAMTEWVDPLGINTPPPYSMLNLKQGYWQMEEANKFNKLRILAQTPLSYMTQTSGEFTPENNGITSESIFCEEEIRSHKCVNYANYISTRKNEVSDWTQNFTLTGLPISSSANTLNLYNGAFPTSMLGFINANTLQSYGDISFQTIGSDGAIVTSPITLNGHIIGLGIQQNAAIEINFNEPVTCIDFNVGTYTDQLVIEYYRIVIDSSTPTGINLVEELITSVTLVQSVANSQEQQYLDDANPVDKMIIRSGTMRKEDELVLCEPELTMEGEQMELFLSTLVSNGQLQSSFVMNTGVNLSIYNGKFFNSPLYQFRGLGSIPNINYLGRARREVLTIRIQDEDNYNCVYTLTGPVDLDWANVTGFSNLRKDPAYPGAGPNNHFLIDVSLVGGGTAVIKGYTPCHNVLNCYSNYTTWLYNVCFLTGEDAAYNETVLNSTESSEQVESLMESIEKTIQPIWRPNTIFAVGIKTNEKVYGGGSANYTNSYFYGFKTAGPIGHFHRYLDNVGTEVINNKYQQLVTANQEDSFILSNLKHYINYAVSYPNANGDLLNAKPLFYNDPKLSLFFTKQYVYSMFEGWDALSGNLATSGGMGIQIQDAIEPPVAPIGTVSWNFDKYPIKGKDTQALSNMVANATGSGCEPPSLSQYGINADIAIDQLEPLKLYTAIFSNTYDDGTNGPVNREVHRYPFRTSRYGSFEEQIQSYILAQELGVPLKTAIFDVNITPTGSEISDALSIIGGSSLLLTDFADKVERIVQGALKLGTLQPAISTEFNFVKNGSTILGVWIRCIEPFNDPKIPSSVMETSITLSINGTGDYTPVFSKDCREIFITNSTMDLPEGDFEFTFHYKEWNQNLQLYVNATTEVVNHTVAITI